LLASCHSAAVALGHGGYWCLDSRCHSIYTKCYRGATVNSERATGWPVATFECLHACPYEPCVMLGLIGVCWGVTSDIKVKVKDIRGLLGGQGHQTLYHWQGITSRSGRKYWCTPPSQLYLQACFHNVCHAHQSVHMCTTNLGFE
jgi:hypothetical protein